MLAERKRQLPFTERGKEDSEGQRGTTGRYRKKIKVYDAAV